MFKFQKDHPLEKRKEEAQRIRTKYPDRIPIIVEVATNADLPALDKHKYLVPSDLSVAQFIFVLRKRIKLTPEKAVFIFVGNLLAPTNKLVSEVYAQHKDEDGFVYFLVSSESTFG